MAEESDKQRRLREIFDKLKSDDSGMKVIEGDPNGLGARLSEQAGDWVLDKTGSPVLAAGAKTLGDLAPLAMGFLGHGPGMMAGVEELALQHPILSKITTPEQAAALKGPARAEYLKALDDVYGPAGKRAEQMGFDPKTKYYHGTTLKDGQRFAEFDPARAEHGFDAFVTPDKSTAKWFAQRREVMNDNYRGGPAILDMRLRGKPVDPYMTLKKNKLLELRSDGYQPNDTWLTVEKPEAIDALRKEGILNPKITETITRGNYSGNGAAKTANNIAVSHGKDLRYSDAAFDPRFTDSSNLMAGKLIGGPPMQQQEQPKNYAQGGLVTTTDEDFKDTPIKTAAVAPTTGASAPPSAIDQSINLVDPDTQEVGSVPAAAASEYIKQGYRQATPQETDAFVHEQKYGGLGQQAVTALEGAGEAATFGLSTLAERAAGVPKEDITGRREINPWVHMGGQGLALIGSSLALPGGGAMGLAERAGLAGGEAVGLGAEAVGLEGFNAARAGGAGYKDAKLVKDVVTAHFSPLEKVGSAAVKGLIENAMIQGGDEVSRMFAQDPNQSVQTAIADVGLAGLIGGGISGGLGAVSPLWHATTGDKLGGWLEAVKRRANGEVTPLPPEVQQAMERLNIEPEFIPPEVRSGIGGTEQEKQAFQVLQESQTPPGLKLQESLKIIRERLQESKELSKDELKSSINEVQANLREASLSENISARDELENLKDQIREKTLGQKGEHQALLDQVQSSIDTATKNVIESGDEQILQSLGKKTGDVKAIGEISLNQAGQRTEESLTEELRGIVEPAQKKYENLKKPFENAKLTAADNTIADQIATMSETEGFNALEGSAEHKVVMDVLASLPRVNSLDGLVKLQSRVRNLAAGKPELFHVTKKVNEILQNTVESVLDRELGKRGPEVVAQWAEAKASWRDVREVLDQLGQRLKPGKYAGPETFINALKNKKLDEQIIKALSGDKDAALLDLLERRFPKTAKNVKQHTLDELIGKAAQRAKDGRVIDSEWLFSQLDSMRPEYRKFVLSLGDEASARTAQESLATKLAEVESAGAKTLAETKLAIEKNKLLSKSEQDMLLNEARTKQQKKMFDIREAARAEIESKRGNAQQKIEDVETIMKNMNHKSSNTAGNLDSLWSKVPGGAMALAAMLTGHNPAVGFMLGQTAKWLSRDAPDAIRLAMLKFLGHDGPVDAGAFKSMVDFVHSVSKGELLVTKGASAVFKAGRQVLTDTQLPNEKDRKRLDKKLKDLRSNSAPLMDTGGKTSHYLPDHGAAMGQTAANAVNYLNSLRPNTDKMKPFDSQVQANPVAEAEYNRALDIAQQPLIVMKNIKDGTLTPQDVVHLKSLYPDLYTKFNNEMMHHVVNMEHGEETIPYKTTLALSLYMGQPLDSTMTPQSLMATQPPPQAPPGTQGQPQPKHSMTAVNKLSKGYSTPSQAREAEKATV